MATIGSVGAAKRAFGRYENRIESSRQYLVSQRTKLQQATSDALTALAVIQHFGSVVSILTGLSVTPGIVQYAKNEASDQAYDIVAEFQTILAAMISARDTLIGMFPKDGNGFLLYQTLNADGTVATRTFTTAQLAPAVAIIDGVIALLS